MRKYYDVSLNLDSFGMPMQNINCIRPLFEDMTVFVTFRGKLFQSAPFHSVSVNITEELDCFKIITDPNSNKRPDLSINNAQELDTGDYFFLKTLIYHKKLDGYNVG